MHELGLQRVGVLEFVHQDHLPAVPRGGPDSRVVAEQPDREDQQVVEPQGAAASPLVGVRENRQPQPFQQGCGDSHAAIVQQLVSPVA